MSFKDFLAIIRLKWKWFYYFTICFTTGTLICVFVLRQTIVPFYVYGMYSFVTPKNSSMSSFRLVINNKEINTFTFLKGEGDVIRSNISRFIYLKKHQFKDSYYYKLKNKFGNKLPSVITEKLFHYENLKFDFIPWLKTYYENSKGIKIKNISIYLIKFDFNRKNQIITPKDSLILKEEFND